MLRTTKSKESISKINNYIKKKKITRYVQWEKLPDTAAFKNKRNTQCLTVSSYRLQTLKLEELDSKKLITFWIIQT